MLNYLPFYALFATCTVYLLNVQRSPNERDFIMPSEHYGLILPRGHHRRTLSGFNVHIIGHYVLIIFFAEYSAGNGDGLLAVKLVYAASRSIIIIMYLL